ncbi:uncharacterized protein LOC135145869 [Zophobas morio]|uniref:uncharacterized protein LOC135145869 n=1 Tax=Zophobas morio TaxID=2755281 RepID=UPI003083799F
MIENTNENTRQHQQNVLLLLEEKLSTCIKRLEKLEAHKAASIQVKKYFDLENLKLVSPRKEDTSLEVSSSLSSEEYLLYKQENENLLEELNNKRDTVLVIVESLHELSEMQNTLCRHIYEQTEQLEHVDQNTVEATESIIEGNKQLAEAVESVFYFWTGMVKNL